MLVVCIGDFSEVWRMINDKEDDSVDLDESNRISNEDLEALQSLQNGFKKCVVSESRFRYLC